MKPNWGFKRGGMGVGSIPKKSSIAGGVWIFSTTHVLLLFYYI